MTPELRSVRLYRLSSVRRAVRLARQRRSVLLARPAPPQHADSTLPTSLQAPIQALDHCGPGATPAPWRHRQTPPAR